MKSKTTKPSALKVFNDNKVTANKKADVAMKSFKKSLPKAQYGENVGTQFKGSELAKEYEKAPMVGAQPEWDYLAQKQNMAKGPRAGKFTSYGVNETEIYRNPKTDKVTMTPASNVYNDPRFSKAQEATNAFYNKEKNAGTLYSNPKEFRARYRTEKNKFADSNTSNSISTVKKKGGPVKMKTGGATKASFKKSLPKAQYGIGSTTPSGQIVKTPEDVAKIKAMQKRLLQKPVDVYTKPIVSKPVPTQKTGGATKATKFAALAPPYNKATAADRIAGAKKNKKK
jgi:hypothetical protein